MGGPTGVIAAVRPVRAVNNPATHFTATWSGARSARCITLPDLKVARAHTSEPRGQNANPAQLSRVADFNFTAILFRVPLIDF